MSPLSSNYWAMSSRVLSQTHQRFSLPQFHNWSEGRRPALWRPARECKSTFIQSDYVNRSTIVAVKKKREEMFAAMDWPKTSGPFLQNIYYTMHWGCWKVSLGRDSQDLNFKTFTWPTFKLILKSRQPISFVFPSRINLLSGVSFVLNQKYVM